MCIIRFFFMIIIIAVLIIGTGWAAMYSFANPEKTKTEICIDFFTGEMFRNA